MRFAVLAKRLVKVPVVEKRLVEVAWVPVALTKVKFCKVLDPERRRFERVVRPPVAVTVPVKLAAEEIVWPLIKPEVTAPRVALPVLREVEKRLVDEAVVEKKLVVVAEVPVAEVKERLVRVAFEPVRVVEKREVEVAEVVVEFAKIASYPAKRSVWKSDVPYLVC